MDTLMIKNQIVVGLGKINIKIMKKLNNLLNFKDFDGSLPTNNQKKTKRTDIGLDILKEGYNDNLDLAGAMGVDLNKLGDILDNHNKKLSKLTKKVNILEEKADGIVNAGWGDMGD